MYSTQIWQLLEAQSSHVVVKPDTAGEKCFLGANTSLR